MQNCEGGCETIYHVFVCHTGVFLCFTPTIMKTKLSYMRSRNCDISAHSPDGDSGRHASDDVIASQSAICRSREIVTDWSVGFGWTSFVALFVAAVAWLYLARRMRIEKSKSIV